MPFLHALRFDWLFGGHASPLAGGAARGLLGDQPSVPVPGEQFSSWLPYVVYHAESQTFSHGDGLGFTLEVMPQSGADEAMTEILKSLYATCPKGTGLQIQLFASPHISATLRRYANLRREDTDQAEKARIAGRPVRNTNLYRVLARARCAHLMRGTTASLSNGFHYNVRHFRLLVSATVPGDAANGTDVESTIALREHVAATLRSANLPSRPCDAADLINWCALFTNPNRLFTSDPPHLHYDDGREIRDQIVDRDTVAQVSAESITFAKPGGESPLQARFYSIRSYPQQYVLWQMGALIGDLMQPALQYTSPFVLTLGVHILDPHAVKTAVTTNFFRATQNAESKLAKVMPDTGKKRDDWGTVAHALDDGGTLVSLYHQLALFCPPERAVAAESAAKAIWRARGFELTADLFMGWQALIASLPMTLSPAFHQDLKKMKRVTRKTNFNAIHLAPLIAEWTGTPTPVMLWGGRRGELITLDLYDNKIGNFNAAIIGAPGSGKSVCLNELAWSYLSVGAKVWMLDLGRSFEKLCQKAGGRHLRFHPGARLCLNPFSVISEETVGPDGISQGGINEDVPMITAVLAKMCSTSGPIGEVQVKAIAAMVKQKYLEYGRDMTVTALRDAFVAGTLPDFGIKNDRRIKDLAIMLNPYCKGGAYEAFFEGRNNVDFDSDFIVIEAEELMRRPDLHTVMTLLLLYQITGDMYLTRNRRKVLIVDELKQQLGEVQRDDLALAGAIEGASRRARKYGGALVTATQGADDYYESLGMEAALNCSDWVFLFRQKEESIQMLEEKKRLAMDPGKKRLLGSLRVEAGVYSECYISSPVGEGVGRLILDPYSHLLFSNRMEDNQPIDELRAQGHSLDAAIKILLERRGIR